MLWRRSYDIPPPPIDNNDQYANFDDPKYAGLPSEARPRTECLKDVLIRALPYWYDEIVPDLLAEKVTLIAAHGNSLRAIVKHLDKWATKRWWPSTFPPVSRWCTSWTTI